MDFEKFLVSDEILDWKNPLVLEKAERLARAPRGRDTVLDAFEWVRDSIPHSWDHHLGPVTCSASEVLSHRTGFCFAKAHLLAALLRAQGIPAGLCYQRISVGRQGVRFYLHGLCAVHLPRWGWYRMDPRGPKPGVEARYTPPTECLAYRSTVPGEKDYPGVFAQPLPVVVETLRRCRTWIEFAEALPDLGEEATLPFPMEAPWGTP